MTSAAAPDPSKRRRRIHRTKQWSQPKINQNKPQKKEMLLGLRDYDVNYRGKGAFIAFCSENLRFTGNWKDFIFRRDLLQEFWKYYEGDKLSPVPIGMHLGAAGVKTTRLGREFGQEYGYSGICFIDGRGRKYFPRKRPRRRPKMTGKWVDMTWGTVRDTRGSTEDLQGSPHHQDDQETALQKDEYQGGTDVSPSSSPSSSLPFKSPKTEESPPDTAPWDPPALLNNDDIPDPYSDISPPSWIEDWKPPVPFTPYELPSPHTPTTVSPGIRDYSFLVPQIPVSSHIQTSPAAPSPWLHTWGCRESAPTHNVFTSHTPAAPPPGTQDTKSPVPYIPDSSPIQHPTPVLSPWLYTWNPAEFLPSNGVPSPHTPAAPPSTIQSGTPPSVGAPLNCLLPPPGLEIDLLEHLNIKEEFWKM